MTRKIYIPPVIERQSTNQIARYSGQQTMSVISEIDGHPVKELAEKYGSPLFVFSEKMIREKYRQTTRTFGVHYPKVQFSWSYKTNYLNAICAIYHQEGAWAEIVSGMEFERARRLGVPGNRIIFNGPGSVRQIWNWRLPLVRQSILIIWTSCFFWRK